MVRGRFRTSKLAQKVYVAAMLACVGLWAFIEVGNYARGTSADEPIVASASHSRKLLSGVEIIPGFTGAKCGTNTYVSTTVWGIHVEAKFTKDEAESNALIKYDPYAKWEADSGGIVYVILSIYLFLGIAIICDGQFIDSLEMICSRYGLDIPPDVAGATFMAAGSSAPELATSFLGTFVAASPVGLGTILGSAVFNILIIIGAVAILTGEVLDLDYRPVVRDNFFYAISVILLCGLLAADDQANLIDTIILLLWYIAYIVFLAFNDTMMDAIFPKPSDADHGVPAPEAGEAGEGEDPPPTPSMGSDNAGLGVQAAVDLEPPAKEEAPADEEAAAGEAASSEEGAGAGMGKGAGDDAAAPEEAAASEEEAPAEEGASPEDLEVEVDGEEDKKRRPSYSVGLADVPEEGSKEEEEMNCMDKTLDILSIPWIFLFDYTMPDCHMDFEDDVEEEYAEKYEAASDEEKEKMKQEAWDGLTCGQKWFWATFFISLLHITWVSYFMVEFMLKIGCLWGIPDVVMGLTFLAMGTSIPDALGSVADRKSVV